MVLKHSSDSAENVAKTPQHEQTTEPSQTSCYASPGQKPHAADENSSTVAQAQQACLTTTETPQNEMECGATKDQLEPAEKPQRTLSNIQAISGVYPEVTTTEFYSQNVEVRTQEQLHEAEHSSDSIHGETIPEKIIASLNEVFDHKAEEVQSKVQELFGTVKEKLHQAGQEAQEKGQEFALKVEEVGSGLRDKMEDIAYIAGEKTQEAFNGVQTKAEEAVSAAASSLQSAAQALEHQGSEILHHAKEFLPDLSNIKDHIQDKVKEFATDVALQTQSAERLAESVQVVKEGLGEVVAQGKEFLSEVAEQTKAKIQASQTDEIGHKGQDATTELLNPTGEEKDAGEAASPDEKYKLLSLLQEAKESSLEAVYEKVSNLSAVEEGKEQVADETIRQKAGKEIRVEEAKPEFKKDSHATPNGEGGVEERLQAVQNFITDAVTRLKESAEGDKNLATAQKAEQRQVEELNKGTGDHEPKTQQQIQNVSKTVVDSSEQLKKSRDNLLEEKGESRLSKSSEIVSSPDVDSPAGSSEGAARAKGSEARGESKKAISGKPEEISSKELESFILSLNEEELQKRASFIENVMNGYSPIRTFLFNLGFKNSYRRKSAKLSSKEESSIDALKTAILEEYTAKMPSKFDQSVREILTPTAARASDKAQNAFFHTLPLVFGGMLYFTKRLSKRYIYPLAGYYVLDFCFLKNLTSRLREKRRVERAVEVSRKFNFDFSGGSATAAAEKEK